VRPLVLATTGVAVLAGLLGGFLLLRPDPVPARVSAPAVTSLAPGARTAEDLARGACVQLRLAAQGIQAGSAAQGVRAQLASARALAAQAVREDGRWAALSGGIAALDEAVRRDEGAAAASGLTVALEQCETLG
jgi:hypothetical protein